MASALSALFFCSKGIFVKEAYTHGADAITILAMRMAMALPVFLLAALASSKGKAALTWAQWRQMILLGFVGYYLSAIINFNGLRFISVGLERIVLFTYPSMVVIGGVLFMGRRLGKGMLSALVVAYSGIVISFVAEAHGKGTPMETAVGVGLVLGSALTYATFVVMSGKLVKELGGLRFTSISATVSCGFVLLHQTIQHSPTALMNATPPVIWNGFILAIFGTLIPFFFMGLGLQKAGAERFAIIGTIGPVGTIFLAWLLLGESMNVAQGLGFLLSLKSTPKPV